MSDIDQKMDDLQAMQLKTKLEMTVASITIVAALIGSLFWIENRYASADGLLEQGLYTRNYHTESEIERAQDKLERFLIIPEEKLFPHQKLEIIRLNVLIERKLRRLEILKERDK